MPARLSAIALACILTHPFTVESAVAQTASTRAADAFLDQTAEVLFLAAQVDRQSVNRSVMRYRAVSRHRLAAAVRGPSRDRTFFRIESAARAIWERDRDAVVQVLAARRHAWGREDPWRDGEDWLNTLTFEHPFEPGGDRLFFGMEEQVQREFWPEEEAFWLIHPLAPGADTLYRYQSGDTLTLTLPDGRVLRTVRLDVPPRVADVRLIAGTLWIDAGSGSLVRAAYRLSRPLDAMRDFPEVRRGAESGEMGFVPGPLKPWTVDLTLLSIDYSLWDLKVWLPRSMRVELEGRMGPVRYPMALDVSYHIESVTLEDDLPRPPPRPEGPGDPLAELSVDHDGAAYELIHRPRSRGGRRSQILVPVDRSHLATSAQLPPPIWDDAPGFASEEELEEMIRTLADLPAVPMQGILRDARWAWHQHDLIRYNRVEGLAVGGRVETEVGGIDGPLAFEATAFLGIADLEPKGRLTLERRSAMRRVALGAFRELRPTDPKGRYLGLGNSLFSLLFGRDDEEYFLATGVEVLWRPPEAEGESFRLRVYAERQDPVLNETDFALFHAFDSDWSFRANVEADPVEEVGGELTLSPWWGTDPTVTQVGLELYGQGGAWRHVDGGATGRYFRASGVLRIAIALAEATWRVGLEAGGGTTWGEAPMQRSWFLGGPVSLRGYEASVQRGTSFTRGRWEVARTFPQAVSVSAFWDVGWAGVYDEFHGENLLYGAGLGFSFLDGLIRMDFSQGLKGPERRFRFDIYLDSLL